MWNFGFLTKNSYFLVLTLIFRDLTHGFFGFFYNTFAKLKEGKITVSNDKYANDSINVNYVRNCILIFIKNYKILNNKNKLMNALQKSCMKNVSMKKLFENPRATKRYIYFFRFRKFETSE